MTKLRKATGMLGLMFSCSALHAANLLNVYNTALQNDPTFRNAEATWMSDKEAAPIARAALLPSLNLAGNYGYTWSHTKGTPNYWSGAYSLTLDQSIFNYNSWSLLSGASNTVKASEATYNTAAQSLIKNTISAYTAVLSAEEQLRVQHAQTQYLLQNLRSTKQQFDVGLKAITDVYDYQSQYDTSVANEIADQNTLSASLETLRASTGISYKTLRGISGTIALRTPKPNNIDQWSDRALRQSYSVKAAYYTAAAAKDNVHAAVGSLLPTVGAEGSYGNTYDAGGVPGTATASAVMLNLSVPIFQGGANYATLHQNRYKYLAAQAALTQAQRDTVSASRKDYLSVIADISSVHANRAAVKSASESLKSNEAGYRVGTKTITDVLQAIQKLYSSEQQKAAAQYQYISDMISLKYDVGTLSINDIKQVNALFNSNFTFTRPLERGQTYTLESMSSLKKNAHAFKPKSKPKLKQKTAPSPKKQSALQPAHLDNNYYALQFYSGANYKSARSFVNRARDKSRLSIVRAYAGGAVHYKVVRGWFPKYSVARAVYSKLGTSGKKLNPWIVRLTPADKLLHGVAPRSMQAKAAASKPKAVVKPAAQSAPKAAAIVVSSPGATKTTTPASEVMPAPKVVPKATTSAPVLNQVTNQPAPAAPVEQHHHYVPKPMPKPMPVPSVPAQN